MGTELYTNYPVQKRVNMTEELAERIADYRFGHRVRSENEAMRQLLELGLEVVAKREKASSSKG